MKSSAVLRGALATLVPSADETLWLRACLDWSARGQSAWEEWQSRLDLRTELNLRGVPYKRLLALLAYACERRGDAPDGEEGAVLRAARLREEARSRQVFEVLRSVIGILDENGLGFRVLRGVVLAQTVYPTPHLRHNHDIDLWLKPSDVERAAHALLAAGFRDAAALPALNPSRRVTHPNGLPISLHSQLFAFESAELARELWTRAETVRWDAAQATTLVPEDALVQLLALVPSSPSRRLRVWACDALLLLRALPNPDWERVLALTSETRATLAVATLLGYLRAELDASVPERVISALKEEAGQARRADYELLLTGLRASGGGGYRRAWQRAEGWRERQIVLRWYLNARLRR